MSLMPNLSLGSDSKFDLRDNTPPFVGGSIPLIKESDPDHKKPQPTSFYNSQQFKLWEPDQLSAYNGLMKTLLVWSERGWCNFNECQEYVASKENWVVWVKFITIRQITSEDLTSMLGQLDRILEKEYAPNAQAQ